MAEEARGGGGEGGQDEVSASVPDSRTEAYASSPGLDYGYEIRGQLELLQ